LFLGFARAVPGGGSNPERGPPVRFLTVHTCMNRGGFASTGIRAGEEQYRSDFSAASGMTSAKPAC